MKNMTNLDRPFWEWGEEVCLIGIIDHRQRLHNSLNGNYQRPSIGLIVNLRFVRQMEVLIQECTAVI